MSVTYNGLVASTESKTGLAYTYAYDALGRRTGATDPRIGDSYTHFNSKGQVEYAYDAASNKTSYAYDADTGRRAAVTNAQRKVTRQSHDPEGRLLKTWGDTAYPVKYAYDEYGRMTSMTTYRSGTNWTSSTWPASEPSGDTTTWQYDQATGLLTNKLFCGTNGVSYAYTSAGKLQTRTWARGEATTYRYDDIGSLTNLDYSATNTTDMVFTYDRLGRQETIADALGTRSFVYNDSLQLAIETNALGVITRAYDSSGRDAGFDLDSILDADYAYSGLGRFNSVTWTNSVVGGPEHSGSYSYMSQSELLEKLDIDNGELVATRFYEASRNQITAVSNVADSTIISLYDYSNVGTQADCGDDVHDDCGRARADLRAGTGYERSFPAGC